ncbi:MAG: hypothetical protein J0M02_16005 [Planctomycetes bacterium]|nr:hypothetical protein [Planctomycetota bacterium]
MQRTSEPARMLLCCLLVAQAAPGAESESQRIPGWGTWTKRVQPVLEGTYGIAGDPDVVRVGSELRMVFGAFDPAKAPQGPATCGAHSIDGLAWTTIDTGDVLVPGRLIHPGTGTWEDTHETPAWLQLPDNTWMMWFIGYIDVGGWVASSPARIGAANSSDGQTFAAIQATPVLSGSDDLDSFSMTSPSVVLHEGVYHMVYAGWGYPEPGVFRGQILRATSTDGVAWTRLPQPVLQRTSLPGFIDESLAEPELLRAPDGTWLLLFTATHGDTGHDIGIASARTLDGPWLVCPQAIIRPTPGAFDAHMAVAPTALIEDGRLRIWYAGSNASRTEIAVGYAETSWPLSGDDDMGDGDDVGGKTSQAVTGGTRGGCGAGGATATAALGALLLTLLQLRCGPKRSATTPL